MTTHRARTYPYNGFYQVTYHYCRDCGRVLSRREREAGYCYRHMPAKLRLLIVAGEEHVILTQERSEVKKSTSKAIGASNLNKIKVCPKCGAKIYNSNGKCDYHGGK